MSNRASGRRFAPGPVCPALDNGLIDFGSGGAVMGFRVGGLFSPTRLVFLAVTAAVVCLAFLPALA